MPREHKIKLYKYSELSDKAKEKARNDWIHSGLAWDSGYDSQVLTEQFKEILQEKGFEKGVEVFWSLSSSQGDGVAFRGSIDVPKYIKAADLTKKFGRLIGKVEARVNQSGRYTHWNSMSVEIFEDDSGGSGSIGPKDWHPGAPTKELIAEFEEYLTQDVKDISRELEKIGYAEIEYKESEEYLADTFEANEYEFTADGKIFHG